MLFSWLVFAFLCLLGYLVRPVSRNERIVAAVMFALLVLMLAALLGWIGARHG